MGLSVSQTDLLSLICCTLLASALAVTVPEVRLNVTAACPEPLGTYTHLPSSLPKPGENFNFRACGEQVESGRGCRRGVSLVQAYVRVMGCRRMGGEKEQPRITA